MELALPSGRVVEAIDDPYSDRLRCDHPAAQNGQALADALRDEARGRERERIVVFARPKLASGLVDEGFQPEAVMPGFYAGETDCVVLADFPTDDRAELANPREVQKVDDLLEKPRAPKPRPDVETFRATPEDAERIAELIGATFTDYPTPSDDADYVRELISDGTPFRYVEEDGEMVSCASADLVRDAKTAELTDCATHPSVRGRGHMRAILEDLMEDLRDLEYATAFTLARARIPGVNIAFQRLGFELRGRMVQSCRIGRGLEDMNVWSRSLLEVPEPVELPS